jgi:hypothetical protein
LAVALVIAINFLIKNDSKDSIKEIETDVEEEPYQIFTKTEEPLSVSEEPSVSTKYVHIPNDGQYYTRPEFDWSNEEMWINNPAAVRHYKNYIEPRKTT